MRTLILILAAFLLSGCASTVKNSWLNFRANYNTYYNAKKSYSSGIHDLDRKESEINPGKPIRVHPVPENANSQDFEKAIEKGARILRKFPDSRLVDEALEIIGKSYYYLGDYFPALQKFEELYENTSSNMMKQKAVLWKGRTLLEMGSHEDAIGYMENELLRQELEWKSEYESDVLILLAEHHAQLGNWTNAAVRLEQSLAGIARGNLKARAYFLYGQILEELDRFGEAYFAYGKVLENAPEFELLYWAELKRGIVLRELENYELAIQQFNAMKRDDKNIQRTNELDFEIALTYEDMDQPDKAVELYEHILRNRINSPSDDLRADTYLRLGNIWSDTYGNFTTAAAYYDSASIFTRRNSAAGTDLDTEILAKAYGSYADLRADISRRDSLLRLSELTEEELDSFLVHLREERLKQFRQEQQNQRNLSNLLVNQGNNRTSRQPEPASVSTIYGFLNYRSNQLVAESKNRFIAVWGNRPLVDDWRRIEVVRLSSVEQENPETREISQNNRESDPNLDKLLNIDLSEIPLSAEDREKLKKEIASSKYKLGNLFFLTMGMPDSAEYYFDSVIRDSPDDSLAAKSIYSLIELYRSNGDSASAAYWRNQLDTRFPDSGLLAQKNDNKLKSRISRFYTPLSMTVDSFSRDKDNPELLVQDIEKLRGLALADSNRQFNEAAQLHYLALNEYIKLAKRYTDSEKYNAYWASREQVAISTAADSADNALFDSTNVINPFTNSLWDSVRTMINEHKTVFPGSGYNEKVAVYDNFILDYEGERTDEALVSTGHTEKESASDVSTDSYGLYGDMYSNQLGGYTIIIHSLRDRDKALEVVNEYNNKGYRTVLMQAVVNGNVYWRIGLGVFKTVTDADNAANEISESYYINNITEPVPYYRDNDDSITETSESQIKRDEIVEKAEPYGLKGTVNSQGNDGYTINIHSLTDEQAARNIVEELNRDGYRTVLARATVKGQVYWRIGIGQFKTVGDAEESAKKLPGRFSNSYFIKKIK